MNVAIRFLAKVGLLTFAVTLPSTGYAQTDIMKVIHEKLSAGIAKLESSCGDDIKKYCSTVTPGEGRALHCMLAHDDKISPKCAYDLHEVALNAQTAADDLKDAAKACRDDIAKSCRKTPPGQGRMMGCLAASKATLSQNCAEALRRLEDAAAK
jgi:hypothetical protein